MITIFVNFGEKIHFSSKNNVMKIVCINQLNLSKNSIFSAIVWRKKSSSHDIWSHWCWVIFALKGVKMTALDWSCLLGQY
jgi:hypothetical protein